MVAYRGAPTDVFQAISDPLRRRILDGLAAGPRRVTDIAGEFAVTRQAVAKHLRVLAAAGLVRVDRHGRERHCHLEGAPLREVDRWLTTYRAHWARRLVDLKRHVERKRRGRTAETR